MFTLQLIDVPFHVVVARLYNHYRSSMTAVDGSVADRRFILPFCALTLYYGLWANGWYANPDTSIQQALALKWLCCCWFREVWRSEASCAGSRAPGRLQLPCSSQVLVLGCSAVYCRVSRHCGGACLCCAPNAAVAVPTSA